MRHRGGAPNGHVLALRAAARRAASAPPDGPVFSAEELAFFWQPRPWLPDIKERFGKGRPGSSDIRDAIIAADDEGGTNDLRWHKEAMAWGLTEKGKKLVSIALSPARLRRARDWKSAKAQEIREPRIEKIELEVVVRESVEVVGFESRSEEIARLAAEQAADE